MTNNHFIAENPESNNPADNHVEREEDHIDFSTLNFPDGDEREDDDDWVELMDVDDDWNECEEDDEPADRYDDCEFHRRSGMHDDWYDDFDDDGAGWDVYQGASDNPYYNDQLDLDQQSDEFWECL